MDRQVLRNKLWEHFSKVEVEKGKLVNVVDVQLAESQTLINLKIRLGELIKKRTLVFRKFYRKWAIEKEIKRKVTLADLKEIAIHRKKHAISEYKKIEKLDKELQDVKQKIKSFDRNKAGLICAYITFETKLQRDKALQHYHANPLTVCLHSLGYLAQKDHRILEENHLVVTEAPAPTNILWTNMDVSATEKFLRRLVSWIITFGLWIISKF